MPLASKPDMEGVPPPVSTDRAEGWRAFHGALYKSAALLARSALEAATHNLGAMGDNLRSRIHALAESGVITTKLAEWADEVRVTGNEAAHEMETVTQEDADAALYFLDSFLDDVYVVPYRQEQRRLAREERARAGEE